MTSQNRTESPPRPLRILSLGWGRQSWAIAAMAALGELPPIDYAVHADTTHESAGTYAHARKWTPWLEEYGVRVVTVKGKPERTSVVNTYETGTKSVLIPAFSADSEGARGQVLRQCTHDWKIVPIRRFIREQLGPGNPPAGAVQMVQGISWEEQRRQRDSDVAYITHDYPLVDLRMTTADCILWLERHGLDVPPKSACVFCPFKRIEQWKSLKREGGSDWARAVHVDNTIRDRRLEAAGLKLYLHPHRKPLEEAVSIPEDNGEFQMEIDFEAPCDSGHCWT